MPERDYVGRGQPENIAVVYIARNPAEAYASELADREWIRLRPSFNPVYGSCGSVLQRGVRFSGPFSRRSKHAGIKQYAFFRFSSWRIPAGHTLHCTSPMWSLCKNSMHRRELTDPSADSLRQFPGDKAL